MSLQELLDVVLRWAHLIAGIMWIGNSMLFNWLDRNLVAPGAGASRLSQGRIFMVHSGAFYEVEKKLLAPGELPAQLHWFKWQNFATWATGISLLVVVYFMNDAAMLRDPLVADLSAGQAIGIAVGALVGGWAIYDLVWRLFERQPVIATALSFVGLFGAAYGFTEVFSGRAAYLMTGALLGTVMTGNVWMRILPSQRSLIAATKKGEEQDATLSKRAKQRSIHNNYMTFPVLFIMVSNHFPTTYGHHLNWLILAVIMVAGAAVRHGMNVRYHGQPWLVIAGAAAVAGLVGVVLLTRVERAPAVVVDREVPFARVQEIVTTRCLVCHSERPTHAVWKSAPLGFKMDQPEQIQLNVAKIRQRAVDTETMPPGNETGMTAEERAELRAWIDQGARL